MKMKDANLFKTVEFCIEIIWNFLTLISKKQFLCNKKPYCTLVPRNFFHWFCTRVQYDYLLHRNCLFKIFIKFQNFQKLHTISKKFKMIKFSKSFKNFIVFIKFQIKSKIEPYVIKQLLYVRKWNVTCIASGQ
jgi:hypothetical protein